MENMYSCKWRQGKKVEGMVLDANPHPSLSVVIRRYPSFGNFSLSVVIRRYPSDG